jgi:hypothetical protein
MLPNLRIVICGVVFGPLLFAVTGAGVFLPDSNTRVGEVPEISRPMMQRVIADEPAQAQFHFMTLARRSEELERLRERAAVEIQPAVAVALPAPESEKPAVVESLVSDDAPATDMTAATLQPPAAAGIVSEAGPNSPQVRQTDVAPDEPDPVEVAAVPLILLNTDQTESAPNLANVRLPPLRPGIGRGGIHKHALRRKHRITQVPQPANNTFGQDLFRSSF